EDIDVSDERIQEVARAFCATAFRCDPKTSEGQLDSETACQSSIAGYTDDDIDRDGSACGDAELDMWECYANASCEEQFTACVDLGDLATQRCPTLDNE